MMVRALKADATARPSPRSRWLPRLLRDLLIAGAVIGGLWMTVVPGMPAGRVWQFVLAALCVVAVVLRTRAPAVATGLATVSTILAWAMGVTADPCVMVGLCLFAVAERRGDRLFPWWVLVATGLIGITMLVTGGEDAQTGIRSVVVSAVVLSAAWALGTRTRQARRESAARARAEERLRLVREVHDVLSHSLGTIGVQAGIAAHGSTLDADRLREILREVETDARSSLNRPGSVGGHDLTRKGSCLHRRSTTKRPRIGRSGCMPTGSLKVASRSDRPASR